MRLESLLAVTARMQPHEIGPTPGGRRIDLHLAGDADPDGRVQGHLEGVDYLTVRADGVLQLNVHATLRTADGDLVAVRGRGMATPTPEGTMAGRLACTFQTASEKLSWLNTTLGVAATKANMRTGELRLAGYTLEE